MLRRLDAYLSFEEAKELGELQKSRTPEDSERYEELRKRARKFRKYAKKSQGNPDRFMTVLKAAYDAKLAKPKPKLTETAKYPIPEDSFRQCQLCGYTNDDICSFHMWYEGDDKDQVESKSSPILITCRQEACDTIIEDHPRLYSRVPWGMGYLGRFVLLCGDCPNRKGTSCTHPDGKDNGGEGLLVKFTNPLGVGMIRIKHSSGGVGTLPTPATSCAGHPEENEP